MPLFLLAARPFPRRWPTWLAPIAAVEYLEAAPAFASNHGLGMAIAQLDLTNWPACVWRITDFPRISNSPHTPPPLKPLVPQQPVFPIPLPSIKLAIE